MTTNLILKNKAILSLSFIVFVLIYSCTGLNNRNYLTQTDTEALIEKSTPAAQQSRNRKSINNNSKKKSSSYSKKSINPAKKKWSKSRYKKQVTIRNLKFTKNKYLKIFLGFLPLFLLLLVSGLLAYNLFTKKKILLFSTPIIVSLALALITKLVHLFWVYQPRRLSRTLREMLENHDYFNYATLTFLLLTIVFAVLYRYYRFSHRKLKWLLISFHALSLMGELTVNLYELRISLIYNVVIHAKFLI